MSTKQPKIELSPAHLNGSLPTGEGLQPKPDAKALFDRAHGTRFLSDSSEEKRGHKRAIKAPPEEMISQQTEGAVSQQALAQVLAAQSAAQSLQVDLTMHKNLQPQVLEVALVSNANILLQARRDVTKQDNSTTSRISDKDGNDDLDVAETDSSTDTTSSEGRQVDTQLSTQAALQQLQSQASRDNQDSSGRRNKGLLAQLIDELVECLHVSERMRADDWQIVIKLKSEILQGTQLHLENYGRRLSVKLLTNNKQAYDLLSQERFELQSTLRASIDQHIDVTTEKV